MSSKEVYEILLEINANISNAVSALEKVTGSIKKTEDSTFSLSKAFETAAGVMIRDFIRGGINAVTSALDTASSAFQDYEFTLTRVLSATSATGDELQSLESELGAVAENQTDLGYSARESAAALESLVKAGMSGEEAAQALKSALMLARIEGIDTAESANYLVQTLTQFNLTAEDSYDALNLISKAADAGIGTASDYAAGLSNCGAAASNMGVSLEETLVSLVILDKTFGSATESGTFLNMLFKDLINKSDKLGISLYNADGSMRSLSEIIGSIKDKVAEFGNNQEAVNKYLSVFDVRAQRAIIGLLNYSGSIEDVTASMGEARDVQEKFDMIMETAAGRAARLAAELENASLELGAMTTEVELAWKQFALALGPIGAVVDALGPTALQGAITGLTLLLPDIWKKLSDVTVSMSGLTISAQSLAVSIAAGLGAFTAVYGILQSLPPEARAVASVIAIVGGALAAAAAAAAVFLGTISVGTAVPIILASVGTAVAGVSVALQDAGASAEDFDKQISQLGTTLSELEKQVVSAKDKSAESLRELLIAAENYNYELLDAESKTFLTYHHMLDEHNEKVEQISEASYDELLTIYDEYASEMRLSSEEFHARIQSIAEYSFSEQLSDLNAFYELQVTLEEQRYADAEHALYESWMSQLEIEESLQDQVIAAYKEHYANIIGDMESAHADEIEEIKSFYDEQIATIEAGLDEIRNMRNEELDQMELDYLKEKALLKQRYEEGIISEEEYQRQLNEIETAYREDRSAARDSWRLKELEYELSHKDEIESLEAESNAAILASDESFAAEKNLIYATLYAVLGSILVSFESEALTNQKNLYNIQTGWTQATADALASIWNNLLGSYQSYASAMEAVANGTISKAEAMKNQVLKAVSIANAAIATMSKPPSETEFYPTGEQPLYDYAKEAYLNEDYNTYLGALQEMKNRGYITESERSQYAAEVPGAATGGVFGLHGPEIIQVGERGPEAVIPLEPKARLSKAVQSSSSFKIDIHITGNTFSSEIDVAKVFEEESEKLARKLVSLGVGRIPV